jgi:transposase-like protein/transposase Tn5 family protein
MSERSEPRMGWAPRGFGLGIDRNWSLVREFFGRLRVRRGMQTARQWAQASFGSAELGDGRRSRRMVELMAGAAARPSGRICDVFAGAAQRQAAYDFVEHESVSADAVIEAVGNACLRQCAQHPRVLIPMDGSSVTLTDRQCSKGFGRIGSLRFAAHGLKVMNTLALTPQGEVLGVPTQHYWTRQKRAKQRGYRGPKQRESAHWRDAVDEVSERRTRLAPDTRLHFIADREADASLLIRHILQHGHEFTIRANGTRTIKLERGRVAIRPWLIRQRAVATMSLKLSAQAAGSEREVELVVRAARVRLVLRDRHSKHRSVREVTVVWAREQGRLSKGQKRIQWMLYTTDLVHSGTQACAVVQRYGLRWRIEEMHRTWKSGACNVETMQLRSPQAAIKWACMLAAVAARIERLKSLSRKSPNEPASIELADVEVRALILLKRDQKKRTESIPDSMPTIAQAVRWIADLGGYIGAKSSGPPGSTVIARGFERVLIAAQVLQALEKVR